MIKLHKCTDARNASHEKVTLRTSVYPKGTNKTLPSAVNASRNLGVSGRFTYGYDSRYFAEFNFGYNGSERFSKDERYGFFPSYGFL